MSKKEKMTADEKVAKLKEKAAKHSRTPLQIVFDLFMSKINDPELQERYDGMERNVKSWKETYNAYVLQYRDAIARKTKITDILLEGARLGIVNPEAMKLDQQVNEEIARLVSLIEEARKNFQNDENLMAKYRDWSDRKLFTYWEIMKELDKDYTDFLTFKSGFKNSIF